MRYTEGVTRPAQPFDLQRHATFKSMNAAWLTEDAGTLLDLKTGPYAELADDLIIVEQRADGEFVYVHYGEGVSRHSGMSMLGKSTKDFDSSVGQFFAQSYRLVLKDNRPHISVNKAKVTHSTHSWRRLLLPLVGEGDEPNRVIVTALAVSMVSDVVTSVARDSGYLGGTLEPIYVDGFASDFLLLPLVPVTVIFGDRPVETIGDLFGRALTQSELSSVLRAAPGENVIERQLPNSRERFGRDLFLRMSGGAGQPAFSISDTTELVRSKAVAEARREAMTDFAESASDWLWETDEDHRFSMISPSMQKLTGLPVSQFIGVSRFAIGADPENQRVLAKHLEDLEARRPFRNLVYKAARLENPLWVRVNGTPRFDQHGNFVGYRGTASNITDEISVQAELEDQRRAMEDFANTASDWMWETDANHIFTYLSDTIEAQTGIPVSEYVGKSRFDLAASMVNETAFIKHRQDLEAKRPFKNLIYEVPNREGENTWIRVSGVPRYDRHGVFIGYRGTGSNITAEMRAKIDLEQQRTAMQEFADSASDWMWETDLSDNFTMLSRRIEEVTGSPPERYVGVNWYDLEEVPENREGFAKNRELRRSHAPFRDFVYKALTDDGKAIWVRTNGRPRFDENGRFVGYRGTAADITEEVEARERVAKQTAELAEAHRLGRLGSWQFDRSTEKVALNEAFVELVGLKPSQSRLSLQQIFAHLDAESRRRVMGAFKRTLQTTDGAQVDIRWKKAGGNCVDLSVTGRCERAADGRIQRLIGSVQDITDRKSAERELHALAYKDSLTQLGNRAAFNEALDGLFDHKNKPDGGERGLLLLDLDNFKDVNDTLGHGAGDELLQTAATRIIESVGVGAEVFRLGGDEFAVITDTIAGQAALVDMGDAIHRSFSDPFHLDEGAVSVSTSTGMVLVPSQAGCAAEAMRFADLALYEAKGLGRNRQLLFQPSLDEQVQEHATLSRDLRRALDGEGLDAHYQMQVDIISGRICGFEALARWVHPTRGFVPPDKFIAIAESSPMIGEIGAFVLRHACAQGRAWLDAGGAPLAMA
ncbi:MAG: PAS domain S-box protein, partial [Pseudomonadota bacterium]